MGSIYATISTFHPEDDPDRISYVRSTSYSNQKNFPPMSSCGRNISARQNYYATLNNTPKPTGRKPRDPDAMDVDAMRTSKLSKEERDRLREERRCFNCQKKGHLARDCRKKNSEQAERKDKGKKPQSRVRSAKVEEVVDDRESEDEGPSTSKEDSLPSYEKKDDLVAAIRRMTAEQREATLEQLAGEGF